MESPPHSTPGEAAAEHQTSFWVVRVPEAVFSTDPQDSLRVSVYLYLKNTSKQVTN